jgi:hypothetical protein
MRQMLLLLSLLLIGVPAGIRAEEAATQLRQMAWLEGTWRRIDLPEGQSGFERWTYDATQGLTGVGVSERNGKPVFEEKLSIVTVNGTIHYVADVPENSEPVHFALTELSDHGFAFENPAHDFPKKIAYRRNGDRLHAKVSAGDKAMEFVFEREP